MNTSYPKQIFSLLLATAALFLVSTHVYAYPAFTEWKVHQASEDDWRPSQGAACLAFGDELQAYFAGVTQGGNKCIFNSGTPVHSGNQCNAILSYVPIKPGAVCTTTFPVFFYGDRQGCFEGAEYVSGQCVSTQSLIAEKNLGSCPAPGALAGNPIHVGIGNKFLSETDYQGNGPGALEFTRFFNSLDDHSTMLGYHWRHSYDRWIALADNGVALKVYRSDGKAYQFFYVAGSWSPDSDVTDVFTELRDGGGVLTGFQYQSEDTVEQYDLAGKLVSITDIAGNQQTLTYNVDGYLGQVTSDTGESLSLLYNARNFVDTLTDSAGRQWTYQYSAFGNLEFIDNPDGTTRQYHYEDPQFPTFLTGITDERGIRYATYEYDAGGNATATYHGPQTGVLTDRIDGVSIVYNPDDSRAVTDSNGIQTVYDTSTTILGVSLVNDIAGPGCASCGTGNTNYSYDAFNNVTFRTENGIITAFGNYDSRGNPGFKIEAQSWPEERRTDYTYDPRFYSTVATITEASIYPGNNKVTTNTYDNFGNILSTSIVGFAPDGTAISRTTSFQYNGPLKQLSQIDGPRTDIADISSFEYYPNDVLEGNNRARLKRATGPTGIVQQDSIQYTATGKVQSETRPNGLNLSYSYYSGNDRLETLTETTGAGTRVTRWTYLATGEVATITVGDGTPDATTISFGYDAAIRLTRVTDGLGNYIEYTLDTEGNREAAKHFDSGNTLHKTLTQTFDLYSRLDVSGQANETTDFDFDPDGTLDRQVDGNNVVTNFSYDSLKRLLTTTQDASSNNAATLYGYDTADRLTTVTDPNSNTTNYVYDDLGNLRSVTSPDTGLSQYSYDAAGNVLSKTDAKGQLFIYGYDAANRLTVVDAPGTADDLSYTYDSCTNGTGRLCSINANGIITTYSYDGFGNVTAHQGIGYSYDTANRRKTLTYPSGAVVTYQYDGAGQVTGVTLTRGAITEGLASNVTYLPFGPVKGLTYGNGNVLTQTFDSAYRVTAQTVPGVLDLTYPIYDAAGNLRRRDDALASPTLQDYVYDAYNRLDSATGPFGSRDYDYDKNGNRTQLDDGAITSYAYEPGSNRLDEVGSNDVVLDATGNTTTQGPLSFDYTAHHRLKEASNTGGVLMTYTYNGLGQRAQKRDPSGAGLDFVYGLNGQLLAETAATGEALVEYVWLNGRPLAMLSHDRDKDGVLDELDNCIDRPNGPLQPDRGGFSQRDTDGDGVGNACDPDLNNDGMANSMDLGIMASVFFTSDANADFNGDGIVNSQDLGVMAQLFFQPPGPSGPNGDASAATPHSIHTDHLGTPVAMTDGAGTVVWNASHDPFGSATVNNDPDGDGVTVVNNLRFPGQYFDTETGLHYNYFRYYDPSIGRYLTNDPIGLFGGINLFTYVRNNPLRLIDPFGLAEFLNGTPLEVEANILTDPLTPDPTSTFPMMEGGVQCTIGCDNGTIEDFIIPIIVSPENPDNPLEGANVRKELDRLIKEKIKEAEELGPDFFCSP